MNPEHAAGAVVMMICDELTDDEIAAMNICVQLGTDPRPVMGYEKAKALFTTEAGDGTPLAHDLTRQCMANATFARLRP